MKALHRILAVLLATLIIDNCCGDKRGLNLNDLLAAVNANKQNKNSNNEESNAAPQQQTLSSTSVKTQEFNDLQSLINAMKGGKDGNTVNLDVGALLAKQKEQNNDKPKEQTVEISPNGEVTSQSTGANAQKSESEENNKNNDSIKGINLSQLAEMLKQHGIENNVEKKEEDNTGNTMAQFLANKKKDEDKIDQPGLQIETEGDNTKNGHSRFTLQQSPDGGLMLVPVKEENGISRGLDIADLAKKPENSVGATNRQQLQLTTLAQALYSPFPGDNILHLHLKGKDGKDGKQGQKGHTGPPGTVGPQGPKGPKGEAGTCAKEVTHQPYTCTPDEIDSLTSRVDYLEKICKKQAPISQIKPSGEKGEPGNPMPSCQSIYEKNKDAKSGAYWLMVNGVRFKTWCEFIKGGGTDEDRRPGLAGGWTLVARIKGQETDWSPISENWASNQTLNDKTAYDVTKTTSMKNMGYVLLNSNVLLVCFTGRNTGCAPFTHSRNMPLAKLFSTQFGVVPDEQYTFATFMKAVGKSCDLSILRQSWCGLNLANVCDAKKGDPNEKPPKTTHIARIGCIGDRTATCFPDDYAIGIGVTSCKDGFGCSNVGPSKNMHYRCDYVYGAFSQTAYLYVL
ncbi:uncharacterized protein LOC135688898 isoform X1 [Rhopilema esculentum]|uniref:uncharacterized protein LOC135688898 isoform X1 n=1 Tax=Rhopilema esculentum TaxID=499914 RepID=UPI0031D43930